ncbi:Bromodomain-containing protein 7 [Orchesella cincta]|uniref:Bromodomain-containing protein 7 n=1 Tax=Orchesella cincta TaxID=48709 RepID=A0A1D2M636_ORCCI|nr:Bromodomain-containing protein 7 [Orchesella cincta]
MGFLRQRPDGSTSLAILTPCSGVLPGTQEQPVVMNVLAGKLTQGTTQLHGSKEEKKNIQRTVKPLYYGAFSSFAPSLDSTFSNLTPTESELVRNTYGDETAIQYAESMIEFAKGCDYAMYMVDELLDTVTKGEHKRTVNVVEERKRVEEEEARIRREQEEFQEQLDMEWENATKAEASSASNDNFDSLRSLSELGIDTSFVEEFKDTGNPVVTVKLEETANLITDLQKAQNDRLRLPSQPISSLCSRAIR